MAVILLAKLLSDYSVFVLASSTQQFHTDRTCSGLGSKIARFTLTEQKCFNQ